MDSKNQGRRRYSREFFFQIINSIADFVRVVDVDNDVIYMNGAMEDSLGGDLSAYEKDKLAKQLLNDFSVTRRTLETGEVIQQDQYYKNQSYSVKTSPLWNGNGELVGAVEVFRKNTRDRILHEELVERNKTMNHEMAMAALIQQALLPEKGFLKNLKVNYLYLPQDIISGDLFDLFPVQDHKIAFYISDTVGHGFASGMTTMFINQAMRTMDSKTLLDPVKTLTLLHKKFIDLHLDTSLYFTIFYGVYDSKDHKISYANAGHNCPPILYSQGRAENLETPGLPIMSYFQEVNYSQKEISAYPGDHLLLYTDGLIESTNRDQEEYGLDRLREVLVQNPWDSIKRVQEDLGKFTGNKFKDDLSILDIKIF